MSNSTSVILLVDNGSTKASATVQLRTIAKKLSERTKQKIYPVSLQHADVIPANELGGDKASILSSFLKGQLQQGCRAFIVLPLFFGNSRALTQFIPDVQAELEAEFGVFELSLRDTLFPIQNAKIKKITGDADTRLSEIIYDHILQTTKANSLALNNIVLVDHGSPSPQITAVRHGVAEQVQAKLGQGALLEQAVMERREGKQYDFNGELLEDWLIAKAKSGETSAIVALLFSLPGRHAGEGGDIVKICDSVMQRYPDFKIGVSPLVGEHPRLLEILADRLNA
ncbi:MAG: CbiX/SirB N-terminal domain-containing protein [Cocleimonas sp.]